MGISTSAVAMIGRHYSDLEEFLEARREIWEQDNPEEEDSWGFNENDFLVEECDMISASPWYDAGQEESFFGFQIAESDSTNTDQVIEDVSKNIREAARKFKEVTGLDGYFLVCPDVC